jgi:hypothetical protein
MSSVTITVEPLARPEGRPSQLIEPVVGFRSWRIQRDGPAAGLLSSPYFPVSWTEPVMRATCRRWRTAEQLLCPAHAAPDVDCGCGIRAYERPTADFSKVDYRAVSGIVTVWGRIAIDRSEMRAELARVEALALYDRWSRRQRDAVRETAAELGADLVGVHELQAAALGYGAPPPPALLAEPRPARVRDRFVALFGSRVGD